MFTRTLADLV